MSKYTIGIDVGGTKIAYGLFDENNNLLVRARQDSNPGMDCEEFFSNIAQKVIEMAPDGDLGKINGVGIGMPSYIDFDAGYIIKTVSLTKLREFHARDFLSEKLGGMKVALDNDAHAAALAEHRYGAGRGFSHMLYCPVSTGLSSGIIINNELFRGSYGFSGESGHTIITPGEGLLCGCGNRGCVMSWCSGLMIVRHIQNWISAGEASIMSELAGSADMIQTAHIDEAFDRGDALAVRAVEQMAGYLAVWLFNLYLTLNINCFVFGGGLLNMGDKLFSRVRRLFDGYNQNSYPVYFKTAELGEDFGIIGAAALVD